ncbi:lysine--tRNA ligase [candidate division WWE3 bacterium RIFCSPLOWO2_02_FULL_53_10]|uniref:Lysine--tRNA ligase n=1 Tax=candidate division WWE3 bacterium RIFCSPLOWO2_02_FULL_53_10 TaxID=1802629 RepID=A0A1F4WQ27_UNCKA|nr:MAG: lysine--tRNA ligase [candidate division WWE3 bacterium RIFCSPLOWO2_02_FULL_53_10]
MPRPLEELRKERLKKLDKIRASGFNPYLSFFDRQHTISQVRKAKIGTKAVVAGRIMAWRGHGKIAFADLADQSAKIQILFQSDKLSAPNLKLLALLDIGDFIGVIGKTIKTQAGELTVEAEDLVLLTKSIRPLPGKSGLDNIEERYRKRYLDLIVNPEIRERFDRVSAILQSMRGFLLKEGYLEVVTPSLQPLYGGTLARPFVTHFNALDADFYLRIANELYLKRLIVGGYEKIFEFSVDFRNEGIDTTHNPEFLQMETMWAYANYRDNMAFAERMVSSIAKEVLGKTKIIYQGQTIDLTPPWKRVRIVEAVEKETKLEWAKVKNLKDAQEAAKKVGVNAAGKKLKGEILEEIFDQRVKDKLFQPTIIHDYPRDISPLAKPVKDNPDYTERFEVFIGGGELANSYSEANDPLLLRENFEEQTKLREAGTEGAHPVDEDFLEAMEYGMPPTSGFGIGMERLFMLLTDTTSIREVMFFPALRPR